MHLGSSGDNGAFTALIQAFSGKADGIGETGKTDQIITVNELHAYILAFANN